MLPEPPVRVASWAELVAKSQQRPCVAFVDIEQLSIVSAVPKELEIVAILDASRLEAIATLTARLTTRPWLSHVLTTDMLSSACARPHLATLLETIENGNEPSVLGPTGVGRAALLASSARRGTRLERMREFFAAHDAPDRAINEIVDIAEELVTNALYDAPAEARFFRTPMSRTEEVELPPEHACEISYGVEDECLFVRVRDPFGAFTHARLMEVLTRHGAAERTLDESRGGAGLGMSHILSKASALVISVIPGRVTDILVRTGMKKMRGQPFALHLFFAERERDGALGRFAADHDHDLMDLSFTVRVA